MDERSLERVGGGGYAGSGGEADGGCGGADYTASFGTVGEEEKVGE